MPTKKRHALDLAWRCLEACNVRAGGPVTAGQLAKEMGVSRNTAHKRLMEMLAEDVIHFHSVPYRGHWKAEFAIGGYDTWKA